MFIMRASWHGIFYTIVVWHDVLQRERMQAKGTAKEWGVKFIKKRREDEHGNIEFLVEWDGDWAETWEPQVNLENAQYKIDAFLASY